MKLAISQMCTRSANYEATIARMVAQSQLARDQGAELIIFPFPALTGPDLGGIGKTDSFGVDIVLAQASLTQKLALPALVPLLLPAPFGSFQEVVFIKNKELIPLRYTFQSMLAQQDPRTWITAATHENIGFCFDDINFMVVCTQDQLKAATKAQVDADVVLYLQNGRFTTHDESTTLAPAISRGFFTKEASELNAWLVGIGGVGGYDDVVHAGGSFVMTPWGELTEVFPNFEEDFRIVEVDPAFEGPVANPQQPPDYVEPQLMWDALVMATRNFLQFDGRMHDAVFNLDGTMATSVLAALTIDAVGPARTRALIVDKGDAAAFRDAKKLARNLHLKADVLSGRQVRMATRALQLDANDTNVIDALVGIRLQNLASEHGGLVLSPVDKTALALELPQTGRMTASMASMMPFGDVYRSQLMGLGRYRASISSSLPASVLTRFELSNMRVAGFGGLSSQKPTQAQLTQIDHFLYSYIEQDMPIGELVSNVQDYHLIKALIGRLAQGEIARRALPSYPVISSCSLSEFSRPIDSAWEDRPRSVADIQAVERFYQQVSAKLSQLSLEKASDENINEAFELLRDMMSAAPEELDEHKHWASGFFSNN